MVKEFFTLTYLVLVCRAIKRSNCYDASEVKTPCHTSSNPYMISFGVIQILLSQIPNFDKIWWLSIVATIMSFTYSTIGLALGIAKISGYTPTLFYFLKAFFQSLVNILFVKV
ncbi:MAG: hypothetical protein Q8877_02640 [Sweet potato little leaf phytoplasma]|nr:hypothetical protein [Sweet potato little leaf phytoplasma]